MTKTNSRCCTEHRPPKNFQRPLFACWPQLRLCKLLLPSHQRDHGQLSIPRAAVCDPTGLWLVRRRRAFSRSAQGGRRGEEKCEEDLCHRVEARQCSGRDCHQVGQEGLCRHPSTSDGCSLECKGQPDGWYVNLPRDEAFVPDIP